MPNVFEQRSEDYAMDAEGYTPPIGPPPMETVDGPPGSSRIVAVFSGRDGSMGFVHGKRYYLNVSKSSIQNVEGGPWIPYGSLEAFFNNWIVSGSH